MTMPGGGKVQGIRKVQAAQMGLDGMVDQVPVLNLYVG